MQEAKGRKVSLRGTLLFTLTATGIALCGCSFTGGPRARLGYLPTTSAPFPNPNRLGTHGYGYSITEASGILYTCRGGHLDLDHVRGNADNTRWLVERVRQTLSNGDKSLSFSLTGEWSSHEVKFTYPPNWDSMSGKKRIIEEISFDAGAYLAYNATLWHEILTWFDVHFIIIEPEFYSAFSWEDVYSNLLGVHLGLEAVKDTRHNYDKAMTMALNRAIERLEVQPAAVARAASKKVEGMWYSGFLVPDTKMRNFDIGLDDGYVTPTLITGVGACNSEPLPLAVPTLDTLHKYGFSIYYEIKPYVLEQDRIFRAAGSKKIIPVEHFQIILQYMKQEAAKKGYKYDA